MHAYALPTDQLGSSLTDSTVRAAGHVLWRVELPQDDRVARGPAGAVQGRIGARRVVGDNGRHIDGEVSASESERERERVLSLQMDRTRSQPRVFCTNSSLHNYRAFLKGHGFSEPIPGSTEEGPAGTRLTLAGHSIAGLFAGWTK